MTGPDFIRFRGEQSRDAGEKAGRSVAGLNSNNQLATPHCLTSVYFKQNKTGVFYSNLNGFLDFFWSDHSLLLMIELFIPTYIMGNEKFDYLKKIHIRISTKITGIFVVCL